MVTSLFIFTRIAYNPLSSVFQKKLAGSPARPVVIILVAYLLLSPVMLPVLFRFPPVQPGHSFFLSMLLCVLQAGYSLALFQALALLSVVFGYEFFR